jgi:Zn-dependent peptidase ImmA (M78 family)
MMSVLVARAAAEKLLQRLGITSAPIDVESIAKALGLRVVYEDLGPDVSALLVTSGAKAAIGIHKDHSRTRQRFSLAHEIAHFVLKHQFEPGEHVHVDSGRLISARSASASAGLDPKEVEANQFAAELLMPTNLIRLHATRFGKGSLLEHEVAELAQHFDVSQQAMTIRLSTLRLA